MSKYDDFAKKYGDFFAPTVKIKVEGKDLVKEGVGISSVVVKNTIDSASDSCQFNIVNAYDIKEREFKWLDSTLKIGKKVDVVMGYKDKLKYVFRGFITSIDINFAENSVPSVKIDCMDDSFKMMNGKTTNSWIDKKDSEVVKEIAQSYGIGSKIDATAIKRNVSQTGETDFEFLCRLQKSNNQYELFIQNAKLFFRKRPSDKSPVIILEWGKNLLSFNPKINITKVISAVIARSYDEKKKETIEGKSKSLKKIGGGSSAKTADKIAKGIPKNDNTQYIYIENADKKELEDKATAELDRKAFQLFQGDGSCVGIPDIMPGKYMKFNGLGKIINGVYYITDTTHTINGSGYTTSFTVKGNAI